MFPVVSLAPGIVPGTHNLNKYLLKEWMIKIKILQQGSKRIVETSKNGTVSDGYN